MAGRFTTAIAALALAGAALAADPTPDPMAVERFEKTVRPILVEKCQRCHREKVKGGLALRSRAEMVKGGATGPAFDEKAPDDSLLLKAVRYKDDALKMPPDGKLTDAEVAALETWVKGGAVWPAADAAAVAAVKPGPLFTPVQKQFWAFQPIRRSPVPTTAEMKPGDPPPNPVDAFVRAKLFAAGLKPSPPADKRTLLRRATFDLTGLPPTPDELAAFEKDTSPQAFEAVLDRLLASPAYGERWGKHWLDVARYADSNGMDENTAFGNAWRYRDYVVRAFNADKPYDVFIKEQIAGDLLPPTNDPATKADRLAALGYLAVGPKLLAEPDKQKMLLDIADEQLDTLGKGVMGLTLGCARCHDHKFDPIPTKDYYSLLAVFTSTRTMQNLNTVAKALERPADATAATEAAEARKKSETLRAEVKQLEKEFGQVPEAEKPKRQAIHEKAEAKRAEIKALAERAVPPTGYLGVEEGTPAAYGTRPRNLHVQVRGNYATPGEEAPAVFPRILAGEQQAPFVQTAPNPVDKPAANTTRFGQLRGASGRLELANWLTDPAHMLTARVIVNRLWLHHFGEGLVHTPDNFGRLGDRPSHPELLDWLAAELVKPTWGVNGKPWALKRLHKLIMLSDTYRQASANTPSENDPENRLLAHFPRKRLEAEAIRDSMLAVAGTLDRTVGGTLYDGKNLEYVGAVKYDAPRRSLYLPVVRGKLFDFFQTFDHPDPAVTVGRRASTVVAPQALYLMNSPFVQAQAVAFAKRIEVGGSDDPARVRFAYRQALVRDATAGEVDRTVEFVAAYAKALEPTEKDAAKRRTAAWAAFTQAVFASSEFLFVE